MVFLKSAFDIFLPINHVWWAIFGVSVSSALHFLYAHFATVPAIQVIGPYGLSIVVLTVIIKLILSPLFQLQIVLSRRAMNQQRKLAPQLSEIKKKYKGDAQKQQKATMELYREHGVNPLSSLSGCLPAIVQYPILIALYFVFRDASQKGTFPISHFLWIPNLNATPLHHTFAGSPIPTPEYLIIPLLAAATTFVQSRMMQQPKNPLATEQEQQQAQMQQSMQVMMPLLFGYFTLVSPTGLGLYWFISNCVAIIQQYFVTGWGGLRRQPPADDLIATQTTAPAVVARPPSNGRAQSSRPSRAARRSKRARR